MKKKAQRWLVGTSISLVAIIVLAIALNLQQKNPSSSLPPSIEYASVSTSDKPELFLSSLASAQESLNKGETEVTVYNSDLALVKEKREINLKKGYNLIKYVDVPALINTTSVFFQDLVDPKAQVVEQSYQNDLIGQDKLLEKYLDKDLTIQAQEGQGVKEYKGKLLSYKDGVILLETDSGVKSFRDASSISFSEIPGGLLTKPTLVWSIYTEKEGKHDAQTSYLTGGLTWNADYIAVVDKDDKNVDIKGWTTIKNESGTAYPNAKLKLVAGDVNRVQPPAQPASGGFARKEAVADEVAAPQFNEQSFFEYHLYSLQRRTDLLNNESKQISLLEAKNVSGEKEYVFDSNSYNYYYAPSGDGKGKVQVKMKLKNSEDKGLGLPLPQGTVRVYKADTDGQLQFIGEDSIDHTPKDEEIDLLLGNAFDLTAVKKQTDSKSTQGLFGFGNCTTTSYEVLLKNHKKEDVTIKVVENTYATNLEVLENNFPFDKKESGKLEFKIPVKQDGEQTLKYSLRNCY